MVVQLTSLRVTAEIDASPYVAGAAAIIAADRGLEDASKRTGAAFVEQNQQLETAGGALGRLSRQYIDGYGSAARFSKAISDLGGVLDRNANVPMAQVSAALEGIYRKFGLAADAEALMRRGQIALAQAAADLNSRLGAQAEAAERAAAATRRAAEAQQSQATYNDRLGVRTDFGTAARAQDIAAYGTELDRLRAKYVPLVAAQQQYRTTLAELGQAYRVGAFRDEREYQAALQRTKDAFAAQVIAIRNGRGANDDHAASAKRAAYESGQLALQLNDVFASIAGGISPIQTLIQQGPQIVQIYGGVGGTLARVKQAMAGIPPVALAVGAAVTALAVPFVAATARAIELDKQIRQIRLTLASTGNASGANAGDIQQQILAASRLPRFDRESADAAAQELLRNPLISGDIFKRLLPIIADVAAGLGKDIPAAAREMADSVTGGVQAADRLLRAYDLLSADEKERVRDLERLGERTAAMNIITEAWERRARTLKGEAVSPLAQATKDLANAWNGVIDSFAKSGVIQTVVGALAELLRTVKDVLNLDLTRVAQIIAVIQNPALAIGGMPTAGSTAGARSGGVIGGAIGGPDPRLRAQIEAQQQYIQRTQDQINDTIMLGETGRLSPGDYTDRLSAYNHQLKDAQTELRKLQEQANATTQAVQSTTQGVTSAAANQAKADALEAIKAINSVEARRAELEGQAKKIQDQIDKGAFQGDQLKAAETAVARLRGEAATLRTPMQELNREQEIQNRLLSVAPQLRDAERAKIETYERVLRETNDTTRAAAEARKAYDLALRQSTESSSRAFAALTAEAQANIEVAAAYLKSGQSVALYTEALRAAQIAEARGEQLGASADAYARQQLENRASAGIKDTAARVAALQQEAVALGRVADAERISSVAGDDAARRERILTDLANLRAIAEAAKNDELVRQVDKLMPAYIKASDDAAAAERRREAIRANRQYDPEAAYRDEVARIDDLAKQGELTVKAEVEMRQEAYIKMGRAGNDWLAGATAGLLEFARTSRQVGGEASAALVQTFSVGTDAIARLMLGMKVNVKSALNDILLSLTRSVVQSQVTGPIAGMLGQLMGGVGGGLGAGAPLMTGGQPLMIGGQPVTIGGAGGGFGGFGGPGGIGNGNFFGLGGPTGWLNTPIGAGSWSSLAPGMYGPPAPGALGGSIFGGMTPGGIIGGVAGAGMGLFNAFRGGQSTTQRIGGGLQAAGSIIGMIPTPWTMAIGAGMQLIGGIMGMFGRKPKTPQEVTEISFGDNGAIETALAMSRGRAPGTTGGAAGDFGTALNGLLGGYDLSMGAGSMGGWLLNSIGKNTGNQWIVGLGSYGSYTPLPAGSGSGLTVDSRGTSISALGSREDAINVLAGLVLRQAAISGTLQGATQTQTTILRNTDLQSLEEIKKALDFSRIYDDIARGNDNITAAEKAVRELNEQFRALTSQAKEYGLDVGVIQQRRQEAIDKLAVDMNEDYRRRLVDQSPAGDVRLAVEDMIKARDEAMKQAAYLNGGVSGVGVQTWRIQQFYQGEFNRMGTEANDNFRRGRLGTTAGGQLTLALEDLDKERVAARAQADIINTVSSVLVDINALEASYATRRKALIDQALGTVYQDTVRGAENITEAEKAVRALNDQFAALKDLAAAAGLAVGPLDYRQQEALAKLSTDINADYRRRTLGLTPEGQRQLALEDMEKERQAALANASYLNRTVTGALVDINQIESYYAQQRVKIIEDANKAAVSGLQDVYNSLLYGQLSGVSPEAAASGSQATYMATLAQAQAGSLEAAQRLSRDASEYIQAATAAYGRGAEFGDIRQQVLADLASIIGQSSGSISANTNQQLSAAAQIMTAQAARIDELTATVERLTDQMALFLAQQRRAA